jgi:transposase
MLRNQLQREQVAAFLTKLPSCSIGVAACGNAHNWARTLYVLGHSV